MSVYMSLFLLTLLLIKHFIADWVVSTDKMAFQKGNNLYYLFLHSTHHVVLTAFILYFFTYVDRIIIVIFYEFFIHSLLDFIKANEHILGKYTLPTKKAFIFLGLDQLMHQLTYVGIVLYLLK